jgi:crossover junction endodeoxyribonuclease RuvC
MLYIGIDPGISGAIAALDLDSKSASFFDTPTVQIKSGKKTKNQQDVYAMVSILRALVEGKDVMVVIEKVNAMPGMGKDGERQTIGATSAFNFGMGYGQWLGILAALGIPHQTVHPKTWKNFMMQDMGKEKDASRVKAMQLFPWSAKDLARKKDHGRADALLMAAWAAKVGARPTSSTSLSAGPLFDVDPLGTF